MKNSDIQWTTHTFNPWIGCQRVSPGCEHCYAEAYDKRVGGVPKKHRPDPSKPLLRWGPKAPRTRTSPSYWRQPLKWNRDAAAAGARERVFCASLADVFEQLAPGQVGNLDSWRLELFELIRVTPHLDWLLLTKRPQLIKHGLTGAIDAFGHTPGCAEAEAMLQRWVDGEPPSNVWLGTTVEDQRRADERIPHLLAVPAVVRFLSCEPLLEAVNLMPWLVHQSACCRACVQNDGWCPSCDRPCKMQPRPDWVIIGGESGGGARPFELEWARDLVAQARSADAAPFVKQLGAAASDPVNGIAGAALKVHPDAAALISKRLRDSHGGDMAEWPADLRVREFPQTSID